VASYEDGVFVLRPLPIPAIRLTIPKLAVTRRHRLRTLWAILTR